MDADELQTRPVALEKLCKEPEKDSPHLLVLENTHTHTTHQKAMPQLHSDKSIMQQTLFSMRIMGNHQLVLSLQR